MHQLPWITEILQRRCLQCTVEPKRAYFQHALDIVIHRPNEVRPCYSGPGDAVRTNANIEIAIQFDTVAT